MIKRNVQLDNNIKKNITFVKIAKLYDTKMYINSRLIVVKVQNNVFKHILQPEIINVFQTIMLH